MSFETAGAHLSPVSTGSLIFGLSPERDEHVIELAENEFIGAVGVLVSAGTFDPHRLERLLERAPRLLLGVKVALTDTAPFTDALTGTAWMHGELFAPCPSSYFKLFRREARLEALIEEWCAQSEYFQGLTGRIDYLDSLKRVHLLPLCVDAALELRDVLDIPQIAVPADSSGGLVRALCEWRGRRRLPAECILRLSEAAFAPPDAYAT